MNMPRLALAALLVAVAFSTGCTFVPQEANIAPAAGVMASDEGRNISVAVRVVDDRPSKSLGRRGNGMVKAAEISSAQDLAAVVHASVVDGLRKKGFVVVDYQGTADPRLTLEIRMLEYSTSAGFWTAGVHVQGAIKAVAVRGAETYDRMYRTENEQRIVIVPTASTNEKWINEALTEVLQQFFDDTGLFRFLAGA